MKTRQKNAKKIVQDKYDQIARRNKQKDESSCCGGTDCCSGMDYSVFNDDYSEVKGYNEDADLGLGCGIPTDYAGLQKGDVVLDLGSGAGNDCFVARSLVGAEGYVYGIDFSEEMLKKSRSNAAKLGYNNMEFVKGDIEAMPFSDNKTDRVLSNCVLNLVPDKKRAFSEIFRVLKPGGSFCISDVVTVGDLPESLQKSAEMYAGCVAGAISREDYLKVIKDAGFFNIQVHKEKEIILPDEILDSYLSSKEKKTFKSSAIGIYSITVTAEKSES